MNTSRLPFASAAGASVDKSGGAPPASQARARFAQVDQIALAHSRSRSPPRCAAAAHRRSRRSRRRSADAIPNRRARSRPRTCASAPRIPATQKLRCRTSTTCRIARPSRLCGSSARNAAKSAGSNALVGGNCHSTGPSLSLSSSTPLPKNRSTECAGLRQHAAMGGEARPLEREHEILRRLLRPAPEARRLLAAVEGAVDLDGGDGAAGMLELARLRQLVRIERAAPGLEHPAADADPDHGPSLSVGIADAVQLIRIPQRPRVPVNRQARCGR